MGYLFDNAGKISRYSYQASCFPEHVLANTCKFMTCGRSTGRKCWRNVNKPHHWFTEKCSKDKLRLFDPWSLTMQPNAGSLIFYVIFIRPQQHKNYKINQYEAGAPLKSELQPFLRNQCKERAKNNDNNYYMACSRHGLWVNNSQQIYLSPVIQERIYVLIMVSNLRQSQNRWGFVFFFHHLFFFYLHCNKVPQNQSYT